MSSKGIGVNPFRSSTDWKPRDHQVTGNFTKETNCWYRECVHHISLVEHLNKKWHSEKSEDDQCKCKFATLRSCWNVNRDKIIMWRVLHHGIYTNKKTSCIGPEVQGLCPRGCNELDLLLILCLTVFTLVVTGMLWPSCVGSVLATRIFFSKEIIYCIF